MDRITLLANDIKAVLLAIDDVALRHGRSLQPKEQKFLVEMDNRLRDKTRATLKIKQARWLTDILAQAPKRTARAKTRAKSNGSRPPKKPLPSPIFPDVFLRKELSFKLVNQTPTVPVIGFPI